MSSRRGNSSAKFKKQKPIDVDSLLLSQVDCQPLGGSTIVPMNGCVWQISQSATDVVKREQVDSSNSSLAGADEDVSSRNSVIQRKNKGMKQELLTDVFPGRKKRDRFNGMSEDQVLMMTLPDHLDFDLDIVIIGINPGLTAAHVGHHYAGPGNHFWKCLYLSGLTSEQMNAYSDYKLKNVGIGFTNIVSRTSRSSADLSRTEIKEGAQILQQKIQKYRPKIAAFNGKGIYEVFCGHKNFYIGRQPEPFPGTDTTVFVMPSSSARCSQLPRAVDKLPFYTALKKLRDHLCGRLPDLDLTEVIFPDLELKVEPKKERLDVEIKSEVSTVEPTTLKRQRQKKVTYASLVNNVSEERLTGACAKVEMDLAGVTAGINTVGGPVGQSPSSVIGSNISTFHQGWPWQPSHRRMDQSRDAVGHLMDISHDAVHKDMTDNGVKLEQPCDLSLYGCMSVGNINNLNRQTNS
jgi:TDG/mug DNA glycosylase family protein